MAVSQQRSDKLLAALDNAIPRHRYKTTIGIKTKGRGFTRPTNASKLKQVAMRTPKKMLLNGAKGESIAMLKNLAKLLVGRIEAACAARKTPQPVSEVPNPKRNLSTAPPSGLLQGPNPEKDAGQEVGNAHEYRSINVDADESSCDYTEKADLPPLDTLELGGNRICQFIQESDRSVDDASRGTPNHGGSSIWETSESCRPKDSRPSSRPDHCSDSIWETSDCYRPEDSRPSSRPNHGINSNWENSESCRQAESRPRSRTDHGIQCDWETSESFRARVPRPISQPNHGSRSNWETSESCRQADSRPSSRPNHGGSSVWETSEICRPKNSRPSSQPNPSGSTSETFEGPDSRPCSRTHREWTETPVRKVASLSSRVITLKKVNVGLDDFEIESSKTGVHSTPDRKRRSPGLRSLVVSQVVKNLPAPPARSPTNTKLVLSSSKSVRKAAEEMKYKVDSVQKGERDEELYEAALADVVQNMFDEVFGDQEQELMNRKRQAPSHQVSSPCHGSAEWLYQRQSIEYSYSTDGAARKGVHCRANVDQRYRTTAPTSRELSDTTPRRRSSREEASNKAPLILPTCAKYHLDKIERYKKCVAEKQVRDALRFSQECSRPSTAPDPYNVLNVFTERCAPQRHVKTAAHDGDGGRELFTNQPRSIPAPTTIMGDRCRASKARQYQPEMDELHDESIDSRGATNLRHKQSRIESKERLSDSKNKTCMEKSFLHGSGDDQRSRNDSQATVPAVSKKTRFVEYWPFLDRQIEGFIQAHILQCCILFKNIPPVFPTLEYQEEIQRLYSAHPLSTR